MENKLKKARPPRANSSKQRLREFFLANIGTILESRDLQNAAGGAIQYSRRLRELREKEGWKILSHNDTTALRPGQYLLVDPPPAKSALSPSSGISTKLRAQVFDRDGFTCQMCGLAPGENDPDTGRPVRLHVGHIVDRNLGGPDELSNLRALCSTCNQGAKNITSEKSSAIWLLSQVRRSGIAEQRAVYDWLKKKLESDKGS